MCVCPEGKLFSKSTVHSAVFSARADSRDSNLEKVFLDLIMNTLNMRLQSDLIANLRMSKYTARFVTSLALGQYNLKPSSWTLEHLPELEIT